MAGLSVLFSLVGVLGLAAVLVTGFLLRRIVVTNAGMIEAGVAIRSGACAFLRRESLALAILIVLVTPVLVTDFRLWTVFTFVLGSSTSLLAAWVGVTAAAKSNLRTSQAAHESGVSRALLVAFAGGSTSGLAAASLSLIGISIVLLLLVQGFLGVPDVLGYAAGATVTALFTRLGGGIFRDSIGLGAYLHFLGGIGSGDRTIMDAARLARGSGSTVGDSAGLGGGLVSTQACAVAATVVVASSGPESVLNIVSENRIYYIGLPVFVVAIGLIASLIGILSTRLLHGMTPPLVRIASILSEVLLVSGSLLAVNSFGLELGVFGAILVGVLCGISASLLSEWYVGGVPGRRIAAFSRTGLVAAMLSGLAVGMQSTLFPVLLIGASVLFAYSMAGIYGIAIASAGMLSNIAIKIALGTYGSIAENSETVSRMSGLEPGIGRISDSVEGLGTTMSAGARGFAVASAGLTALALFTAYCKMMGAPSLDIVDPLVLSGLFMGGSLPFLVAGITLSSALKSARDVVEKVRRYVSNLGGDSDSESRADVSAYIDSSVQSSFWGLAIPALLAIAGPFSAGVFLGPAALGGLLAGVTATGLLIAVFTANSGGALSNVRKWLADAQASGQDSSMLTSADGGAVVGELFRHTMGPAMTVVIKLVPLLGLMILPHL